MPVKDVTTKKTRDNFLVLEDELAIITKSLIKNQELLKLLYYTGGPIDDKPDITDPEILLDIAENNISIEPDLQIPENEGCRLIISFDGLTPNSINPEYIDELIFFTIICPKGSWGNLGSYMIRPARIMHEIQKTFNRKKLLGLGRLNFVGANRLVLGIGSGYEIVYSALNDL